MPSPISFIIPALNEEAALAPMLDGLRAALDAAACADADIIVVDNGSRDATAAVTRKHGTRVISEPRRVRAALRPIRLIRIHNPSRPGKRKSNSQLTSM
jgi:glycosyltransferase involved in cell wall biosynthesis